MIHILLLRDALEQEQPEFESYTPAMLNYCEQDVILNEAVYKYLLDEGTGFSKQSFDLEQKTASIIREQEKTGFYFDSQQAMTLLAQLSQNKADVEDEVQKTFKPKWVEDKMVLPYTNKNGELSKRGLTDDEYENILISKFLNFTGYEKNKIIFKKTHGWKYSFNYTGSVFKSYWNKKYRLGVCADWFIGPKAESAWISANDLFKKIQKKSPR